MQINLSLCRTSDHYFLMSIQQMSETFLKFLQVKQIMAAERM